MSSSSSDKNRSLEESLTDKIPSDLMTRIMSWLNLKALARCTLVCKKWNFLITSPSFISHHFHSGNAREKECLLIQLCCKESDSDYQEFYTLCSDDEGMDLLQDLSLPPIHRCKKKASFFSVVDSCNGIVCLADCHFYAFILWNPVLRKYVVLPRPGLNQLFGGETSLGFGFDSTHDDFKVVKLINFYPNLKAWVCSLAAMSWKSIVTELPPCLINLGRSNVFLNGKLHWVARHRTQGQHNFVLNFDLAEEEFGEILLPNIISEEESMTSTLVFARGDSLAVTYAIEILEKKIWCIYIMKEYGVVESWTKVVRVLEEYDLIPRNVFALRMNGEMILELRNGKLVRYNPTTKAIDELEYEADRVFICYHKESLFLFDKGEGYIEEKV